MEEKHPSIFHIALLNAQWRQSKVSIDWLECVPLGWPGWGWVIRNHSLIMRHQINQRIHSEKRFNCLSCMIRVILKQWFWSGSSQRKAPLLAEKVHARLYSSDKTSTESNQSTFKPCFTDTSLLETVYFVPGEKSPYVFSIKFNPLNSDIPLIRTRSKAPSVSLLMRFDCTKFLSCFCFVRAWSFQNYAKITLLC